MKRIILILLLCTISTIVFCQETTNVANVPQGKSLNDIRFGGWTQKEWLDNEYIRAIRKHLDAYHKGEIKDANLDQHKAYINGKFVIGNIEPYLLEGAFVYLMFVDNPSKVFTTWVYSDVDEKTESVLGYECRGLKLEDYESEFTKEEILQISKEHPEMKLW